MTDEALSSSLRSVQHLAKAIKNNIERVMIGKSDVIDLLLVALLSDGHVLIEDVPGMGKTMLAKSLARSLGAPFQRIQGTPIYFPPISPGSVTSINGIMNSSFVKDHSLQRYCWSMKSTGQLLVPNQHYLRPWPNAR
jgi:hypothetical protein